MIVIGFEAGTPVSVNGTELGAVDLIAALNTIGWQSQNVLFNAIVVMAHALGMRVVAEGVETLDQLRALQSLGCDEVQGFYVSRPVAVAATPVVVAEEVVPALAAECPALMQQECLFPPLRPGLRLVSGD